MKIRTKVLRVLKFANESSFNTGKKDSMLLSSLIAPKIITFDLIYIYLPVNSFDTMVLFSLLRMKVKYT